MSEAEAGGLKGLLVVEERGIEPVPENEQKGNPRELFWVWFAANISILGLPLGAWVVGGVLNIWQALLAAIIGSTCSFAIVGVVSISGQRSGAPTLTISRAVFGSIGNFFPTIVAILSRWGWETVNAVTATFALLSVFKLSFGTSDIPKQAPLLAILSVFIFILATLLVSGLGHSTLLVIQKWATWIFGALTIVVIGFLLTKVDWAVIGAGSAGNFGAFVAAISVVASGTGIAWANSGADIARYQNRAIPGSRLIGASAIGAGIPLVLMITVGSLIAISNQGFDPDNPLSSIPNLLPQWMAIPFLIAAFAGLLLSNNISVYSSGLTLLTLGVKTRRIWAVSADLLVGFIGSLVFMFLFEDFYAPFIGFIIALAIPLTAWLGVFLVDMLYRKNYDTAALMDLSAEGQYWYTGGINWPALTSWLLAIVAGYAFMFEPLSQTWIAVNSVTWAVALVVSGLLYAVLRQFGQKK